MIPFSLCEMACVLNAKHVGIDCIIHTISIHSNYIDEQCMFIALLGKRFDGHNFAKHAVISGATAILVDRYLFLNIPQLIVVDTYCALRKLAHWVCQQTSARVIAITGSSGKTTVKEMTASILKSCGRVVATKNNFNNMVGISMTLLRLTKEDNFAIIEVGISCVGEITSLIDLFSIDVAVVNNVFPSHISGFKSLTIIKEEKGKIFLGLSSLGEGVVNLDSHALFLWHDTLRGKKLWKFSMNKTAESDFFASDVLSYREGVQFILHTPIGFALVYISMLGEHNIANALAASALAFVMGATLSQIVFGLKHVKISLGRLFPIILEKGKLLLDDTYNSNVGSMIAAIRVLHKLQGYKVLVVSDMLELGEYKSINYHSYIGKYINTTNIDQVLTIGNISYIIYKFCKKPGGHFYDKLDLIIYLKQVLFKHKLINIVVKGSRNFEMEKIVDAIVGR